MGALFSKKNKEVFSTPLGLNNPVTVQVLGICSALAVTAKLEPAIVMGLSVTVITAFSNVVISLLRKTIPNRLALTQRMFDGELAGQRGATGQRDLHQIARRELATILAELNVCAIVAERIPRTVLVTLNPQSLTHSCSFIFSRRRSGPSPCQRGERGTWPLSRISGLLYYAPKLHWCTWL